MNLYDRSFLLKLIILSLFTAIIILFALTPIGYLKVGIVSITFIPVVIILGAILLGPASSAFLGFVFGATSFFQCLFGLDPFGVALFNISPSLTLILCFLPRTLMGFLSGYLFRALNKSKLNSNISTYLTAASAPLFNSVLFITLLLLFFGNSSYIQSFVETAGTKSMVIFAFVFFGINVVSELIICSIIGFIVSKALKKVIKNI